MSQNQIGKKQESDFSGAAAFVGNILVLIPTATLFGLFLYLGVMGLLSTQLWHRMVLYFVPHKYFPNEGYCKDVKMRRMHCYTTIQLACFSCLWIVKMFSSASMAFPFVLVTIAGIRKYFIGRIFLKEELFSLEGLQQNRIPNYEQTTKDFYDEVNDDKVV
uniref:Bicarbonate transporter-like transmembrane domain-containing protein n=1 Tax=Romanomermis culicivorax TaxID=13658 RepID=A0A915KS92_ROMCU